MVVTTRFKVAAPLEPVWRYMLDVEKIAPCVPGGRLTEVIDEKTFAGVVGIKLGAIEVGYRGTVHLEEVDDANHTVRLRAEGRESRGRGGASAVVNVRLEQEGETTVVTMETDVTVSGLVAQFGRSSIMQEVSQRMAQRFAECLERQIAASREGSTAGQG